MKRLIWVLCLFTLLYSCGKEEDDPSPMDNDDPIEDPMDDDMEEDDDDDATDEDEEDPSDDDTMDDEEEEADEDSEDESSDESLTSLEIEIKGHVRTFVEEAFFRSIELDTTDLVIRFDSTLVATSCTLYSPIPEDGETVTPEIVINPLVQKWANDQEMEAFWFHMLGHVLMHREHDNDLLPNNEDPKSLMYEGYISNYALCPYPINNTIVCGHRGKREYYIDEMFLPNTPVPTWGN